MPSDMNGTLIYVGISLCLSKPSTRHSGSALPNTDVGLRLLEAAFCFRWLELGLGATETRLLDAHFQCHVGRI